MEKQVGQRKKMNKGCFITWVIFLSVLGLIAAGIVTAIIVSSNTDKLQDIRQLTDEQRSQVREALDACDVKNIKVLQYEEFLDDAKGEGSKGYRISTDDANNIMLYLNADGTVNCVRYADRDLYADQEMKKKLSDFILTTNEKYDLIFRAEEAVKSVLTSPKSAEFPPLQEWVLKKDPDTKKITIQSYVDSQNAFGAMLRSEFQIVLNGTSVESFVFAGEKII